MRMRRVAIASAAAVAIAAGIFALRLEQRPAASAALPADALTAAASPRTTDFPDGHAPDQAAPDPADPAAPDQAAPDRAARDRAARDPAASAEVRAFEAPSSAPADENRLARIERTIAESMYERSGADLVDELAARGLAASDAQVTVSTAFAGFASCTLDALRRQADEEGVSFTSVLDAVEATLSQSDGPLVTALVDGERAQAKALPCLLDVRQEAGIDLR